MGGLIIFLIRAVLSAMLAVLIERVFFQSTALPKIILLAVVMLGLAYLFEYTKKRDSGGEYGK